MAGSYTLRDEHGIMRARFPASYVHQIVSANMARWDDYRKRQNHGPAKIVRAARVSDDFKVEPFSGFIIYLWTGDVFVPDAD